MHMTLYIITTRQSLLKIMPCSHSKVWFGSVEDIYKSQQLSKGESSGKIGKRNYLILMHYFNLFTKVS